MMNLNTLAHTFKEIFSHDDHPECYYAPGRVNIIGEHTDYNGGHVLPYAINRGTYALAKKTSGSVIRLFSINYKATGLIKTEINRIAYDAKNSWANYPLGIVQTLHDNAYSINTGFDMLFFGDIPHSSGLSSSASIELATITALNDLYHLEISPLTMVKLSQQSENNFNHVQCGIMDQFACGMSKQGHAILLHAHTLDYRYVPISLKNNIMLITHSNQRRKLVDSAYNQRRSECQRALKAFQEKLPIQSLCDLSPEVFEEQQSLLKNPITLKRARHVIYENHRALSAVDALNKGDLTLLGQLMLDSHRSLRDDYDVSTYALDTLVDLALMHGAIGARMTGAGFGGCTISLVPQDKVQSLMEQVSLGYQHKTNGHADFYIVHSDDGARKLDYHE